MEQNKFVFSNGWVVSMETIYPRQAEEILEKQNLGNRRVRKDKVKKLTHSMEQGGFVLSPDGIVFDVFGDLMQGQHRLTAVVESDVPATMVVWRNVSRDVYAVLDDTCARTVADRMQLPRLYVDPVNVLCRLYFGTHYSVDDAQRMFDASAVAIEKLNESSARNVRVFSQAPIRAAAIVRILQNDGSANWTINQYSALTRLEYCEMDLSVQALCRQLQASKISGNDLLVRAFIAFELAGKSKTKIQVKTTIRAFEKIRTVIKAALGDK